MEFLETLKTEIGLTDDQLPKLTEAITGYTAGLQKQWDGKANENAERIIQGAADRVEQITGVKREIGQKLADYIAAAGEKYLTGTKAELERKIAEGSTDVTLKTELERVKGELDGLKKKEAQFADWEENDYKGKYEQSSQAMTAMERKVAFSNIRPAFPESVNPYEAKAKWKEFEDKTIERYEIKISDDGEAVAVDKTNEYKIVKLSELLKADKDITELIKGREAKGLGSGTKQNVKIDGVPFDVPENATSEDRNKAIKEYLTGTLQFAITSPEYSKKFAEFNLKLLEKNPKK
jgi:hypothetical protein